MSSFFKANPEPSAPLRPAALSPGRYNFVVKPITAVRIFWSACVALFLSAVVGLHWGAEISMALLPGSQRGGADRDLLHGIWVTRSIFLFLLCALCGVLGFYFSLRASDRQQS